jgi:sugar O-acyltransferase (sialic acid O-acetyltransferase NeuD family)
MERIVLVGSGGCMRELFWQIMEANKIVQRWTVDGYIDIVEDLNFDGIYPCTYLGDDAYLLGLKIRTNVVICVGDPQKRRKIAERYKENPNLIFPVIDLTCGGVSPDATIEEGCILSRGAVVSANVTLGKFVFLNLNATVCHDGVVADYVTFSPGTTLAGNVEVGEETFFGIHASVIPGQTIGSQVVVGAGAVVTHDIPDHMVVVGVPAREVG